MPKRTHQIITTRTGHCYVSLGGKRVYLGPQGAEATELEYHRVVMEYLSGRLGQGRTVALVLGRYLRHTDSYYGDSSQRHVVRAATLYLSPYLEQRADTFTPLDLERVRAAMVKAGLSRRTCNRYVGEIRRVFKWAVSRGLVQQDTYAALCTLEPLRAGRTRAPETEAVQAVSEEHIAAVRDHLAPHLWAMVQLQLLTGARPGEVTAMRPRDVGTGSDIWEYRPAKHKGSWRGATRIIYIGPQAQDVLRPYLLRSGDAPCFGSYSSASYRRAVTRACDRAGVPRWTPNQLRHTAATRVRRAHGLEAAQVVLGHSRADVTQIYAERDAALARAIAEKMG